LQETLRGLDAGDCVLRRIPLTSDLAAAQETEDSIKHELRFVGDLPDAFLDERLRSRELSNAGDSTCQSTCSLRARGLFRQSARARISLFEDSTSPGVLILSRVLTAD